MKKNHNPKNKAGTETFLMQLRGTKVYPPKIRNMEEGESGVV